MTAEVTIKCTLRESEYIVEGLKHLGREPLVNGKIARTDFGSEDRTRIVVLAGTLKRRNK